MTDAGILPPLDGPSSEHSRIGVWLDGDWGRLGRFLPHLVETVSGLERRVVGFRPITGAIDTTPPAGRLIFHLFGVIGPFERDLIRGGSDGPGGNGAAEGREDRPLRSV